MHVTDAPEPTRADLVAKALRIHDAALGCVKTWQKAGKTITQESPDYRGATAALELAAKLLGLLPERREDGAGGVVGRLALAELQGQAARELLADDAARSLVRGLLAEYDARGSAGASVPSAPAEETER